MDSEINRCYRNKKQQETEFVMERNRAKGRWESKVKQRHDLGMINMDNP